VISEVAASETEGAQTDVRARRGKDCKTEAIETGKDLESPAEEGESPVGETIAREQDPEYHETRETLWEHGGTTPQG
jgi:hypothetical protein